MNGLLFAGLLCPHLCAAAALAQEKNTGREKGAEMQRYLFLLIVEF